MGTAIVSLLLLALVSGVIASIIKDKRKGRHPSCGGHCGSCGHVCSAYQFKRREPTDCGKSGGKPMHLMSFLLKLFIQG